MQCAREDTASSISQLCALAVIEDDDCNLALEEKYSAKCVSVSFTSVVYGKQPRCQTLRPPTPDDFDIARHEVNNWLLYKTSWCKTWRCCPYSRKCRFCHKGEILQKRPHLDVIDREIFLYAWKLAYRRAGFVSSHF